MVCTTITVLEIPPSIGIIDKSLTVNGIIPTQCAAPVSAAIGFAITLTLVYTRNISAKVDISLTTPTETKIVTYSSLSLSVGTITYYLGYTAEVYAVGTYTLNSVTVTPV